LLQREQELRNLDEELAKQRQELLWVTVEKEYKLLDQIPDGRDADFPLRRHDEY